MLSPVTSDRASIVKHTGARYPWAKFDSPASFHRLEHHCADVAACFEALLRDPVLRHRFARASSQPLDPVFEARLAVIAFLHDFGKLNAGFQFKVHDRAELPPGVPPRSGHVAEALLCFDQEHLCTAIGLYEMCETWGDGFVPLLLAGLAHHGRPAVKPHSGLGPATLWQPYAGYDPHAAATLLGRRVRTWFPAAFAEGPTLPESAELGHLFAGTVALADQIGSDKTQFRLVAEPDTDYIERARRRAERAVKARHLRRGDWPSRAASVEFADLFDYPEPRPVQAAVAEAPHTCPLLVLESETGSGKTEAAVLRFSALWRAGLVDGLYFAVPTRAAAKQLHRRVDAALRRLFPEDVGAETVLAIPGYLQAGDVKGRPAAEFQIEWEDEPDEETRLARWSAETSRRFLTAPAAVGTVDQALLAALRVKWAHLRGSSLSRSLLVVDEAHASDAYMIELLRALLRGHLQAGGHALLMSATLGAQARVALTDQRARALIPPLVDTEAVPYPALTLAGRGEPETCALSGTGLTKSVEVSVNPFMKEPWRIAELALRAARDGAKVLVIRNTVQQAQEVFRAVQEQGGTDLSLQVQGVPALHHSRFAAEDRVLLDDAVEKALGKGRTPGGVVVVGTQTLEQSLDIDADLLVSDLCPVDVLLQRIGRLHRHRESQRAAAFATARCVVLVPEEGLAAGLDGGLMRYGLGATKDGGGIYRDLLGLEATCRLIGEHPVWTIPAMNRMLVERATHGDTLRELANELGDRWVDHERGTFGSAAAERSVARGHLLDRSAPFDEEVTFHDQDEQIRTRLGEDGPRIVLAESRTGPFGVSVRTFNLPAHLFRRGTRGLPTKHEIDAAYADPTPEGLTLSLGEWALHYDRMGVRSCT